MSYLLNYIWGDSTEIFEFQYQLFGNPTDIKETNKNIDKIDFESINTMKIINQTIKNLPEFIKNAKNMKTLIIEDSNIESLDLDILENLYQLKKIILINIKINKFNCTNKIKIENLIINQCHQIDINLISNIKSLRELYYINNSITEICDLSDLENLTILDLHNNCIESIDKIGKLKKLISLNIGGNLISNIDKIQYCENLKYIYCNKNKIESIECLKNLNKITYLIANLNQIKNIDFITELHNLEVLHIDENLIRKIPNLLKLKNLKYDELHIDWKLIEDVVDMKGFKLIKNIILNLIKK